MIITAGKTNVTVDVYFVDDDGGTAPGEPTTGKLFSDIETGGSASYHRQGAARVDFTLVTQTVAGAHTNGGFIEIDATNMPGLYRLDMPDAAFATGVDYVMVQLVMASANNSIMRPLLIDLTDVDLRDGVRGGMTALPNAAADAAGGLATSAGGATGIDDLATPTNITAGTITTTTNLTNLPSIPANWLTAAGIAASALDGKGDWNIGKTGYSLTQSFPTNFADMSITVTTGLVDVTQAAADKVWSAATRELTSNANLNDPTAATIADAVHDEALSGHQAQGTAGAAITMTAYLGPHGPGVYIDDGAANTGTTLGDDGTVENPVSTIAAATTIASSLGIQVFYLLNDTVLTLAQAYEGYVFVGLGLSNKITLGSSDVDNSEFHNLILTGTQGGTGQMHAIGCSLTALASAEIIANACWLTGNNGLRAATTHIFKFCCSAVAGQSTPDLTFPGSGTTEVSFRHYSGGLTVKDATTNDTMSFEADGQLIIDASCTSLTVSVRGNCQITDNGTTTSLTQEAAINLTNINAEVVDVLTVDTISELAQAAPSATPTIATAIMLPYMALRNKLTVTSGEKGIHDDAGAKIVKKDLSDDGTTYTENEAVSGA